MLLFVFFSYLRHGKMEFVKTKTDWMRTETPQMGKYSHEFCFFLFWVVACPIISGYSGLSCYITVIWMLWLMFFFFLSVASSVWREQSGLGRRIGYDRSRRIHGSRRRPFHLAPTPGSHSKLPPMASLTLDFSCHLLRSTFVTLIYLNLFKILQTSLRPRTLSRRRLRQHETDMANDPLPSELP